jgi:hypothetical protein
MGDMMNSHQRDLSDYGVPVEYDPRCADKSVLFQVIQGHWKTFLSEHSIDSRFLPDYVVRHFERFLECGIPAHGAMRVSCEHCGKDFLVPFSCKGRGFCE